MKLLKMAKHSTIQYNRTQTAAESVNFLYEMPVLLLSLFLYMKIPLFKSNCPFSVTERIDTYGYCCAKSSRYIINPRRACARVTVLVLSVCLSVCLCVCFPYSGTSRNQAYKQQYQRLQRDTGMKYKKGFFFKTLRSEVMLTSSYSGVVSGILVPFFRRN